MQVRRNEDSGTDSSTSEVCVRPAHVSDREQLARLRETLWPDASTQEDARELEAILGGHAPGALPVIYLVAEAGDRKLIGFLEAGLRSHADGCNPSHPVGFIEGWYVAEGFRHQGIGRRLLAAAEQWARSQGCIEMASDTWIDNDLSQRVHEALGYEVVDRCVNYRKLLTPS